jgi:hypothetical protein
MDVFYNSIKCTQCRDVLKSPVILPCGHAICNQHVQENTKEIDCSVCNSTHAVPTSGGGFTRILAFESLLNVNIQKAKFCPQYEDSYKSLKEFEAKCDEFKSLHKDPVYFVGETIRELKIQTDLLREEFKLKIDQKADQLIKELDAYEQECGRSSNETNAQTKEMDSYLSFWNEQIDKWNQALSNFDSNEACWQEINESTKA